MRVAFQEQPRLDCPRVDAVPLNLNCRDEIIPILRALQHVYEQVPLRDEILELVGKDVNRDSSPDRGREGLGYWAIMVLAAVRLVATSITTSCKTWRSNTRLAVDDGYRRLGRPNGLRLATHPRQPVLVATTNVEKINHLIVAAGHELAPEAIEAVRGDTFVVETNIHYPTESTLIEDGLGKVVALATVLAEAHSLPGWRQHEHLLHKVKEVVRQIGRASRAKSKGADRPSQAISVY